MSDLLPVNEEKDKKKTKKEEKRRRAQYEVEQVLWESLTLQSSMWNNFFGMLFFSGHFFVTLWIEMMEVFDPRSHQDSRASRGGSSLQDGRAQTCQKIQQRSTIWENAISDERAICSTVFCFWTRFCILQKKLFFRYRWMQASTTLSFRCLLLRNKVDLDSRPESWILRCELTW